MRWRSSPEPPSGWPRFTPELAGGLLTLMVLAATVIGPLLGSLTAAFPMRRSNLIVGFLIATILAWTVVLLWPGAVPLPVFVVFVVGVILDLRAPDGATT